MSIQIINKENQAYGAFNGGEIVENKPIGFPREGGHTKPYSSLFYWANAIAKADSTIGLHPHEGFEIMSFVIEGTIRHYDTQLKDWKELNVGDAQIIRAGNGISHAEHMAKDGRMFQIWVDPNLKKTMQQPASYNDYPAAEIPSSVQGDLKILHYAGDQGIMQLDTDNISIQRWELNGSHSIEEINTIHSLYVLSGKISINGKDAKTDDFIIVEGEVAQLTGEGELFVISTGQTLDYETYGEIMQRRM